MKIPLFKKIKPPSIVCTMTDIDVVTIPEALLRIADVIELRIDLFDDTSIEKVTNIFKTAKEKFNKPLIATVRDIKEGGQKEFSDRFLLYETVISYADCIDVEVNSEELLNKIRDILRGEKTLIGSYHNFELTPEDDFLESIITKGKNSGVDIIKIATKARDRDELIRLLLFTLKHKNSGIITMCMGDKGLSSRIIAPIFGSLLTYGYINRPSAPGQLSIAQLSELFRILKIR